MLALASGSLVVAALRWPSWPRRRWPLAAWSIALAVAAVVPTDPIGSPSTAGGIVHAVAALTAIGSLFGAELASARDPEVAEPSRLAAVAVVTALGLAPVLGFGVAERIAVAAHLSWLWRVATPR